MITSTLTLTSGIYIINSITQDHQNKVQRCQVCVGGHTIVLLIRVLLHLQNFFYIFKLFLNS